MAFAQRHIDTAFDVLDDENNNYVAAFKTVEREIKQSRSTPERDLWKGTLDVLRYWADAEVK